MELIPWRGVLAPLGVPGTDGRTLARTLRLVSVTGGPLPLYLHDPHALIGRLDMASVDAAQGALVAAGQVKASAMMPDGRPVVDAMRAGELVPAFAVDTTTVEAGEVTSCRVMYAVAQPPELAVWPGRASFEVQPV